MTIASTKKWQVKRISTNFSMENYSVYAHTNKSNGKKYIGITSQKPKERWKNGKGYKSQKRFYDAIKCYGWDNFIHEIIADNLSKEDAEKLEQELIAFHKANDLAYGYNIENGGETHKLSESQKQHLSKINTGKHHTEETRRKMSAAHKGTGAWLVGTHSSIECRKKMGESRKGARNVRAKAVYQYSLDGDFVAKYDYMEQVKERLDIKSTSHISRCCIGLRKKAHGYMWSYQLEEKAPYTRKGGIVNG